jgi:hypothetical protein
MWTFSCVAVAVGAVVEVEVAMLYINWSVTIRQQPGIDIVFVVAVVEALLPLPWLGLVALTQRSRGSDPTSKRRCSIVLCGCCDFQICDL